MRELLFSYPLNPNRIRDLFRGNDFTAARLFTHTKKKNLKNLVQRVDFTKSNSLKVQANKFRNILKNLS